MATLRPEAHYKVRKCFIRPSRALYGLIEWYCAASVAIIAVVVASVVAVVVAVVVAIMRLHKSVQAFTSQSLTWSLGCKGLVRAL